LTPRGAQGFTAHYDTHDVFVLQIEGTKQWRFYAPVRELPLAEEWRPLHKDEIGPVTMEAVMRPGDTLYMPRGHIHEAFTSEDLSLHLTVGVRVFRWLDLLQRAVAIAAARDVRFRAALPAGLLTDPEAAAPRGRVQELLHAVAETVRTEEAVAGLAATFLPALAGLPNHHFALDTTDAIGQDTVLERSQGMICRAFPSGGGRAALYFSGGQLEGPPKIASALYFIARTPRFAVRSLPDDLNTEGKLVLVRRLVRDRLLTVVPAPPAAAP
jgi:hypothetical protein